MEDNDIWLGLSGLVVLLALITGLPYGAYKYGRTVERRLLMQYFSQMVSDTYNGAYQDGFTMGKMLDNKACQEEIEDLRKAYEEDENGRY